MALKLVNELFESFSVVHEAYKAIDVFGRPQTEAQAAAFMAHYGDGVVTLRDAAVRFAKASRELADRTEKMYRGLYRPQKVGVVSLKFTTYMSYASVRVIYPYVLHFATDPLGTEVLEIVLISEVRFVWFGTFI
jgi:hypothetical protein